MTENSSETDAKGDEQSEDGANNGATGALPPPTTPEERIVSLTAERDELKDRMLRVAAEFDNWKKRARKEQTEGEARVREGVLKDLLEVADNLDRAVSAQATKAGDGQVDAAALLKGVELVRRLFQQKLERYDVKPFEAKGQPFDPKVHEAISKVPSPEVPAGAVASEFAKGYRIGDRLLRPAMVAVSTGPAGTNAEAKGQA